MVRGRVGRWRGCRPRSAPLLVYFWVQQTGSRPRHSPLPHTHACNLRPRDPDELRWLPAAAGKNSHSLHELAAGELDDAAGTSRNHSSPAMAGGLEQAGAGEMQGRRRPTHTPPTSPRSTPPLFRCQLMMTCPPVCLPGYLT